MPHGQWIFGGDVRNDALCRKLLGHELKSNQAIADLSLPLQSPLMASFTYRGRRVLCASLLPIAGR
jgi:hypothetical protein